MNQRRIEKRMRRAVSFWNASVDTICASITHSRNKDMARFKWSQLVWQEITMFISLDKQVDDSELRWICRRRGFTRHQRRFLKRALCHVGLR